MSYLYYKLLYLVKNCALLFCFFSGVAIAQNSDQRIYLHTDKQCYFAGETIWFKVYIMRQFAPDDEISNLFLQFTDINGNLLVEKRFPVFMGTCNGEIETNALLSQGVYLVKAYTKNGNRIINSHIKAISILNPDVAYPPRLVNKSADSCIFFFPNKIINGIPVTGYFRAVGTGNMPVHIRGELLDEKGQLLNQFADAYLGAGQFQWTPVSGKRYTAKITFPDGRARSYDMPSVADEGVAIFLDNEKEFISVRVSQMGGLQKEKLLLLGVMGNGIAFRHNFEMTGRLYNVKIPVEMLPEGVLRIYVIRNEEVTAELKTYIRGKDNGAIKITAEGDSIKLLFPQDLLGSFSVAITEYEKEIQVLHATMRAEILLNREDSLGLTVAKSEDMGNQELMEMLVNTLPVSKQIDLGIDKGLQEEILDTSFITVKGRVLDKKTGRALSGGKILLFFKGKDSASAIFTPEVSEGGVFSVGSLLFYDSANISYEWQGKRAAVVQVDEKEAVPGSVREMRNYVVDYSVFENAKNLGKAQLKDEAIADSIASGNMLQNVTVNTRTGLLKEQLNKKYASGLFQSSGMAKIFDLVNEPPGNGGMNVFEYIQGKISDLMVSRTNLGQYALSSIRGMSLLGASGEIRLFLDQSEVRQDILSALQVRNVAMIKYFPPGTARLPGIGAAGVLAVYSKKSGDINMPGNRKFEGSFKIMGYSTSKDFNKISGNATVYWNPQIILNGSENVYTIKVDRKISGKKLHVVVEGFSNEGNIYYLDTLLNTK